MIEFDTGVSEAMEIARKAGAYPYENGSVEEARAIYNVIIPLRRGAMPEVASVVERNIAAGSLALRLRIYRGLSAPAQGARALLYIHGGGWVLGNMQSHEDICRRIANEAGCVVIYPDYRCAPEAVFPAAVDDCAAALRYLFRFAEEIGISPERIAVGGDSAGGNLAAVMAIVAREEKLGRLVAQLLFYPNTDASQSADSYCRYASGYGLTASTMRWYRNHYLPDETKIHDWRVSPLKAASLAGLPPVYIALAEYDILRDEGLAYAERLRAKGNVVMISEWSRQIHGFLSIGRTVPASDRCLTEAIAFWRDQENASENLSRES